jgi:hypothetical protein
MSTCAASVPWVDVVVADDVGTGVGVAAGVGVEGVASVDGVLAGDALVAAGAGLALGVAGDEQPLTTAIAATAKAAGIATRLTMAAVRADLATFFMALSFRVWA